MSEYEVAPTESANQPAKQWPCWRHVTRHDVCECGQGRYVHCPAFFELVVVPYPIEMDLKVVVPRSLLGVVILTWPLCGCHIY